MRVSFQQGQVGLYMRLRAVKARYTSPGDPRCHRVVSPCSRRVFVVMRFAITLVAAIMITMPEFGLRAENSPSSQELLKRIDAAKREHQNYYLRNVTLVTLATDYGDGKPLRATKYSYIAGDNGFLFRVLEKRDLARNEPLPIPEHFWVGRSGWLFRITQKSADEYLISAALPWNDENFFQICRAESGVTIPLATFEIAISDYLHLPDVTIRSSNKAEWHGKTLTKVSIFRSLKGGFEEDIFFDEGHGWLYQGYDHRRGRTLSAVSRVFYQPDGVTPQKSEYHVYPANGPPQIHYLAEVLEFRKEKHADREFSLTQFGLPDPIEENPTKRTPRYLWFVIAGVVFAGLAFGARALAKRRK